MQKPITYILMIIAAATITACNTSGIKKTKTGIEYRFFTDVEGKTPKKGDCISCTISYRTQGDSVLGLRENYRFIVMGDSADGSLDEGIAMMNPGRQRNVFNFGRFHICEGRSGNARSI